MPKYFIVDKCHENNKEQYKLLLKKVNIVTVHKDDELQTIDTDGCTRIISTYCYTILDLNDLTRLEN